MKKLLPLILFLAATPLLASDAIKRGAPLSNATPTPLATVLASPD